MSNEQEAERSLKDSDIAFMHSFKDTHGQYDIPDRYIVAFLTEGSEDYFDGYTQLADAYNLWTDAITHATGVTT